MLSCSSARLLLLESTDRRGLWISGDLFVADGGGSGEICVCVYVPRCLGDSLGVSVLCVCVETCGSHRVVSVCVRVPCASGVSSPVGPRVS